MRKTYLLAPLCALTLLVGCGSEPAEVTTESAEERAEARAVASAERTEVILASLKQADLLDGKEDKVVGKCYMCNLGMDGSEEFAVDIHGYKAHLCSEGCQVHFQGSADDVIASTDIPKVK